MSLESTIRKALGFTGLPCATGEYMGDASAYLVIHRNTVGAGYADDAPQYERQLVQLHLHCPIDQDTIQMQKAIKRAIQQAGFTYPTTEDATDRTGQHVVFEFEGIEGVA